MEALASHPGVHEVDISRIKRLFGRLGAQTSVKRVLQTLIEDMEPGDEKKVLDEIFPLCKHLLIADRRSATGGEPLVESSKVIFLQLFCSNIYHGEGMSAQKSASAL